MHNHLCTTEWRVLDEIIYKLHAVDSYQELKDFMLHNVVEFIDADFASWKEYTHPMDVYSILSSRTYNKRLEEVAQQLKSSIQSHPVIQKLILDTSGGEIRTIESVERLLDHTSQKDFFSSDYYKHIGSKFEIRDQLFTQVCANDQQGILLIYHSNKDFSHNDTLKLFILRGHFLIKLYSVTKDEDLRLHRKQRVSNKLQNSLTKREMEVLKHVCAGKSNSEIATESHISKRTVDKHVSNILSKLNENSRSRLIAIYSQLF